MKDLQTAFGLKLKEHRKLAKLTQEQLAEKLDIAHQTISSYERGLGFPSYPVLVKIIEVLNLKPRYLFTFADEEEPSEDEFSLFILEAVNKLDYPKKKIALKLIQSLTEGD